MPLTSSCGCRIVSDAGVPGAASGYVQRLPDRLDGYTLRALFGPMLLALVVLLLAQLLERLLRLFDLAAATGASPLLVAKMIASLVPHLSGHGAAGGLLRRHLHVGGAHRR